MSLTFFFSVQALRNIKNLVPLLDRVLVQRLKPETKTASGIFLPESTQKDINQATVLAVGPGALDRTGNKIPMSVASGDKVLIPQVCVWQTLGTDLRERKKKKKHETNQRQSIVRWQPHQGRRGRIHSFQGL